MSYSYIDRSGKAELGFPHHYTTDPIGSYVRERNAITEAFITSRTFEVRQSGYLPNRSPQLRPDDFPNFGSSQFWRLTFTQRRLDE